jgi:hypothetical protein
MWCLWWVYVQMFDHSLVDKCRKKFKADDAFPEVRSYDDLQ